jgi:hypothetical protein
MDCPAVAKGYQIRAGQSAIAIVVNQNWWNLEEQDPVD